MKLLLRAKTTGKNRSNFYVDDCLRSVEDEDAAVKLIQGLRQACAKGEFYLNKLTHQQKPCSSAWNQFPWKSFLDGGP